MGRPVVGVDPSTGRRGLQQGYRGQDQDRHDPRPYEQSVQTKVATGDVPDLAMWQPTTSMLTSLGAKEHLQVLDDAPWESKTDKNVLAAGGSLDGHRYAAFVSAPSVMGVWYNKEVFAKNGIQVPKNFDEMLTIAKKLKAAGQTPFYEMGGEWWASQWAVQVQVADAAKAGLWDKVNKNEDKFTGTEIQGAINTYDTMIKEGLFNSDITTGTFNDQAKALLDGKAAMAIQVTSLLGNMAARADTATLDKKIGFFPISKSGTVQRRSPTRPTPWSPSNRRMPRRRLRHVSSSPTGCPTTTRPSSRYKTPFHH
ncbi:ABC transporter [Cutibacterium acnes JCM 18918]|nr:ABC transporter [Cutibacterium acnes JCM 18918]